MKILKSWLQDHIEETLPSDEEIVDALTLRSSEVEGIEKIQIEGMEDTVFDIKILPDRAHYMLSHRGVAYDLCAVLNLTLKKAKLELPKIGKDVIVKIESDMCLRYTAVLINNITNTVPPVRLKNCLEAIGARSISTIVDATNYAMFDTGQPLHAFDADKVVGGITVRFAKDGEIIETLSGQTISLKPNHLIIADDEGPLALAGIKGGKKAEVTMDTKNIILESASFNPISVRKTSFEVSIRNDSSKRFENEITPYLTEKGISKFLDIIERNSPNCKIGTMTDIHKKLPEPWMIKVAHKDIEAILNYKIKSERVKEILTRLDCEVSREYEVTPPFERLDLIIAEDIIDEIGRIEGLNNIKGLIPKVKTDHKFSDEFIITEKIKDFFVGRGFSEVQTRSFANIGDIEVAYPMASDKGFLRTSLIENISESMRLAEKNSLLLGLDKIQIFEVGKTFPKTGERLDLCIGISYVKKMKNKDQVINTEIENLLKELEAELGVKIESSIDSNLGYVKNLDKINTKSNIDSIKIEKGSRTIFIPFSNEPFIARDIALFVESTIDSDSVKKVIRDSIISVANELLVKGPDLFDQFEKEGKKSMAFRMIFQADNRTLTDSEVNTFMEEVYKNVEKNGWQVR